MSMLHHHNNNPPALHYLNRFLVAPPLPNYCPMCVAIRPEALPAQFPLWDSSDYAAFEKGWAQTEAHIQQQQDQQPAAS